MKLEVLVINGKNRFNRNAVIEFPGLRLNQPKPISDIKQFLEKRKLSVYEYSLLLGDGVKVKSFVENDVVFYLDANYKTQLKTILNRLDISKNIYSFLLNHPNHLIRINNGHLTKSAKKIKSLDHYFDKLYWKRTKEIKEDMEKHPENYTIVS